MAYHGDDYSVPQVKDVGGTTRRCVGCDREGVARQQILALRDRERVLKLHPSGRVGRHGHGSAIYSKRNHHP
jgi:hypothetical protein